MDDELDPWPSQADIDAYEEDMKRQADNPLPPPTEAEINAIVEEWLRYHEAHIRIVDDYYAAVRSRTGTTPPF